MLLEKHLYICFCKMYQRIYGLKIYGAIFFNHESQEDQRNMCPKKIIKHSCEILKNKRKFLYLGDTSAKIDWGYAKDYVYYSWKIMQKKPDFYIIATGKTTSVKDFVGKVFKNWDLILTSI